MVRLVAALLAWQILGGFPAFAAQTSAAPGQEVYAEALALYRDGDYAAAAAVLDSADERGVAGSPHLALLGWCRLNMAGLAAAGEAFRRAVELDPGSAEARSGLGYVAFRGGDLPTAREEFERAVALDSRAGDAWKGLGLALLRAGEAREALGAFGKAVARSPADAEARRLLRRAREAVLLTEEHRPRPAADPDTPLRVDARARAGRFEVREGSEWEPLWVKGVNLGSALPGRWAVEFPDDPELYRQWFDQMGQLGLNAVRLYTLHPPSLYRALALHNASDPERKLRLVQGVWAELPPGHDYDDPAFAGAVQAEIRRVIDAVHGNLALPPRPGHAHGIYDADLSGDVLAFILGREWEPFSVVAYHEMRPERDAFRGSYVRAETARPMEAWLASILEVAAEHQTEYYRRQVPIAFSSWPTLDPLHHPTESTAAEEWAIRGEDPAMYDLSRPIYDEDRVVVDARRVISTAAFEAGLFASYHVYPYYPDFLFLDADYRTVRDSEGPSPYFGYLQQLARLHGDQPVLVAELGVPSSRGISHLHPMGQHHGGHTTVEQGEIDARLLRNIHRAGLAGGMVFSWIDEWWKSNWAVRGREVPYERNRLWLNVMDPEQSFGLIAAWPGANGWKITLDGDAADWNGVAPLYSSGDGRLRELRATSDEAYLYLYLGLDGDDALDWDRSAYWVGVDTHDAGRGDRRLPDPVDAELAVGLEFLIRFEGPEESRILVDPPYRVFEGAPARTCRSEPNADGVFVEIVTESNRERHGRDGTRFPAQTYSRSRLRHGTTDRSSTDYDSLADWFAAPGGKFIEARIAWGLLNVTDPSSHQVVEEKPQPEGVARTRTTDGFRLHVVALERTEQGRLQIIDEFPGSDTPPLADYPVYTWPGWNQPTYHLTPKRSYHILKEQLARLP